METVKQAKLGFADIYQGSALLNELVGGVVLYSKLSPSQNEVMIQLYCMCLL